MEERETELQATQLHKPQIWLFTLNIYIGAMNIFTTWLELFGKKFD